MATKGKDLELAKKLEELLAKEIGEGTAASVALIKEGEVIAAAAAGTQDGDPAHPATTEDLYIVGSVSKVYDTAAAMKLVEMGKLDLDRPVYQYLPRFTMKDERYKKITTRHCLNHSSGLPGTCESGAFMATFRGPGFYYDEFYDYLSKSVLKADPGENIVYCNDGFTLAEIVIAEVAGMSFTTFLQKYILEPLGCVSSCSAENDPDHRTRIHEKGKPTENVTLIGCGGISTDLSDCARFGWSFIEPGKALSKESVAEMGSYQPQKPGIPFGLGWDCVNFTGSAGVDLGEGTLMKSGGTVSFGSYLIASPKLRMSGAISMTNDCKNAPLNVLVKAFGIALGIEAKAAEPGPAVPLPEGFAEKYAGYYYSFNTEYEVSFPDDKLCIKKNTCSGMADSVKDIVFTGNCFEIGGGVGFMFETDARGIKYLRNKVPFGAGAFAEIPASFPPVNEKWLSRDGKRFMCVSGDPADLVFEGGVVAAIKAEKDRGVVYYTSHHFEGDNLMPAFVKNDDETLMFLTGDSTASRDIYPFFITHRDGVEYLYNKGFTYIEEAAAETLKEGSFTLKAREVKHFKVPEGGFKIDHGTARVIVSDKETAVTHDSLLKGPLTELDGAYVMFLAEEDTEIKVCAR